MYKLTINLDGEIFKITVLADSEELAKSQATADITELRTGEDTVTKIEEVS